MNKKIWFLLAAILCIASSIMGAFVLKMINNHYPPIKPYIAAVDEDRAKAIALEKAGLTANQVIFDRIEIDKENGIYQYEIEFKSGSIEYDANVSISDGTILSWEQSFND